MSKKRPYNFGAGPATIPACILEEARDELLDWQGLGMSALEVGHRTPVVQQLLATAETDLRELLSIPNNYYVLFLGMPTRLQFSMIPMNFVSAHEKPAYLVSGVWSSMAYEEAARIVSVQRVYSPAACDTSAPYFYFTPNETVNGVRFPNVPDVSSPIVADMTSSLLSEEIDVNAFGLIFAGAQKNISAAGLTIVILRHDLLDKIKDEKLPTLMDYRTHVQHNSQYATLPVFQCYLASKMFAWVKAQGGVRVLAQRNREKSQALYHFIDSSSFYRCDVEKHKRSFVNVCFNLVYPEYETLFLEEAAANGLLALQGHRLVGGMRASLYNALPMEAVDALIAFMHAFSKEHSV